MQVAWSRLVEFNQSQNSTQNTHNTQEYNEENHIHHKTDYRNNKRLFYGNR